MGFEELIPGKGKKRLLKTRAGEIPPPAPAPVPAPVPETMRIRILRRITSTKHGTFQIGVVAELPVALAKDWIGMGLAEQDKMLTGAPETK